MKKTINLRTLTNRAKAGIAIVGILSVGATSYAVQQANVIGAEEPNPVIEQVNDHENRIGTLEVRADDTDAKVEKNSQDITVIQQETGIAPAAPSNGDGDTTTEPTPTPTPTTPTQPATEPEPTPEPPKDPRYITAVTDTPRDGGLHICDYTLYDANHDAKQGAVRQPVSQPCYSVGQILPY